MAARQFTTPVGRLVRGSLYKPSTTDAEGKPLVVKSGPNTGQPRVDYFFELAIPKGPEQHWNQTPWGAEIWQAGVTAFPQAHQSPAFAWKVTDGDSQIPNKKGRKPCDTEGYRGHWVLRMSSGFAPKIYQQSQGAWVAFAEPDAVKLGYYVQVTVACDGNGSQSQPGVFLNHGMVAFRGYGPEIVVGPDVESAGFGAAPLPAGASAVPLAGSMPPAPGAAPAPLVPAAALPAAMPYTPVGVPTPAALVPTGIVPVPGAAYTIEQCRAANPPWTDDQIVAAGYAMRPSAPLPPATSVPAPAAPAAPIAPATVVPNPAFAQIPAPAPVTPPAPPAAAGPQLTPAGAALGTYDGFIAQGWTPEAMRGAGYLA
jgi:hypothetical protein